MKNTFVVFLLSLAIIIIFYGCEKDDSGTQPDKKGKLNYEDKINVFSFHNAYGYWAEIFVTDSNDNATSVTVTGPGITGTMNLQYRSGDGLSPKMFWHSYNPSLGSLVPTTPQIYNIVITNKSGDTTCYSKTITGYVEAFATNLSPTGNVGGTVIFSWTGIANADRYYVELSGNSNNRIWNSIPSTTTSVTYNGDTTLISGRTYSYGIISSKTTDGVSNRSSANTTFTYTGL
jgi:hypothetical protein